MRVGDLVRRVGIGKDRLGVVIKSDEDRALFFVCWGSRSGWIRSSILEVVNESR